ncbi:hypothetical protein PENTCL1PPCAC_16385, partial [Pristionchus entomophagus]
FLLCFYLAFYTMTFVLIDYSFLYRMWAVEAPERVRYFSKPWFIGLLALVAAVEFSIWYCNSFFIFNGTPEGRDEMREIVMDKYGVDTRDHSMIIGDYIRNGTFHVRSMTGYCIYVSVLSICFGFMIFASVRITTFLGKAATKISTKTRKLQTQLFRMLCWQTVIPFIFLYIPCGASLTLPLLHFDASPLADVTSLLLSFFLPLDAVVVIYMMRDYRSAVARMLFCSGISMDESELEKEEEVRLEKLVPIVLIAANIFGCIISLALLKLLFMTRLHVNCKFLLKTWTTCFLVQFVLNIVIFALNFSMDELPKNKQDPPIRHTLYSLELTAQQISTIYELGVATERIISSIRPEEYYRSRLAWKLLYPITVTICGCSLWSQVLFTNEGYHSLFVAVVLSLDIFTICV